MPFTAENLREMVREVILDDVVEEIKIGNIDCSEETGNALMNYVAGFGSLRELSFKNFLQRQSMLKEVATVKKLATVCRQIKKLTIQSMSLLDVKARADLVDLFQKLLESGGAPLNEINLRSFAEDRGDPQQGKQVLKALLNYRAPSTLIELNLGDCQSWFSAGSCFEQLVNLLPKLTSLHSLNLQGNRFSAEQTE